MIRKSHSWSLTWTRDKSADQSGPSIVSPPSGQPVQQAFSSRFAVRTSYLSRHGGQSQSRQRQAHHADAGYTSHFGPRISYLSRGWCLYPHRSSDVPIPFAIVRVLFAIIRDIFTPLPPQGSPNPQSAIRTPHSTSPSPLSNLHFAFSTLHSISPSPQACRSLFRNLYRTLWRPFVLQFRTSPVATSLCPASTRKTRKYTPVHGPVHEKYTTFMRSYTKYTQKRIPSLDALKPRTFQPGPSAQSFAFFRDVSRSFRFFHDLPLSLVPLPPGLRFHPICTLHSQLCIRSAPPGAPKSALRSPQSL